MTRYGAVYFRRGRTNSENLPDQIRRAIKEGAENKIYLLADARAKYGDVRAVLAEIQFSGVERISILAETPYRPAP